MLYNVRSVRFRDGVTDTKIFKHAILKGEQKKLVFAEIKERRKRTDKEKEDDKRRSLSRTKQRIYEIVRNDDWEYFVTLTFDGQKVNRYDYGETSKKLSQWLKNLHRRLPDIRYMFVPEKHKDGAYHFHGIIACCAGLHLTDSDKKDHGRPIYNIGSYRLGWSTATRVRDNAAVVRYITKYITKEVEVDAKGRKRYWCSKNLIRPEVKTGLIGLSDQGLLSMELQDSCVYKNIVQNGFNEVQYFEHAPGTLDEMYLMGLLQSKQRDAIIET